MGSDTGISGYLDAGIKTEALRQSAIANNIANLNTPGYRRVDVKFNQVLAEKIGEGREISTDEMEPNLFEPKDSPVNDQGNDVTIDNEVGEMVKNSLRHKTYMRLLAMRYREMDLAINLNK